MVHSFLSIAFVMATAGVIFNVKARMVKETTWQVRRCSLAGGGEGGRCSLSWLADTLTRPRPRAQLELSGKLTQQRRVEAIDKLLTLLTLLVSTVLGLQAVGLDGAAAL